MSNLMFTLTQMLFMDYKTSRQSLRNRTVSEIYKENVTSENTQRLQKLFIFMYKDKTHVICHWTRCTYVYPILIYADVQQC